MRIWQYCPALCYTAPVFIRQFLSTFEQLCQHLQEKNLAVSETELQAARLFAEQLVPEEKMMEAYAVGEILTDFSPDPATIIASVLLGCSDLPEPPLEQIEEEFGEAVGEIITALSRIAVLTRGALENPANHVEVLRKMFLALAKDVRVVFLKLANRLYTMRHIALLPEQKAVQFASEVFNLYGPIASRLGIYRIKRELEDRAFAFLQPREYRKVMHQVQKILENYPAFLEKGQTALTDILVLSGVNGEVHGRVKDPFSIYQKLQRKETNRIEDIHDLFAFRIIVDAVPECYGALGLVHQRWKVLSSRFKDYIALPKPNGYRSLHTTILGVFDETTDPYTVEVQIRTKEMHELSEFGAAVHWHYKEQKREQKLLEKNWFAELAKISRNLNATENFKIFAREFLGDRIFVLTEKGDVKVLPEGATPIDFAYSIHSEVGNRCQSALINGRIVPLSTVLQNGDVVRIVTSKKAAPRDSWLKLAASPSARQRIRLFLHRHDTGYFVREGRRLLNEMLKKNGLPLLDTNLTFLKNFDSTKSLSLRERENILQRIGTGDISPLFLIKKLLTRRPPAEKYPLPLLTAAVEPPENILITGEKGYRIKKAKCCSPEKKDEIIAFITRGGSCTIHRQNCRTLNKLAAERFLPASWESS